MLRHFIMKCMPPSARETAGRDRGAVGITEVEKRAVREFRLPTPARAKFNLIEEPNGAAIGVGLPVQEPAGNMIIDLGGGTTEVALISLSGLSSAAVWRGGRRAR